MTDLAHKITALNIKVKGPEIYILPPTGKPEQ